MRVPIVVYVPDIEPGVEEQAVQPADLSGVERVPDAVRRALAILEHHDHLALRAAAEIGVHEAGRILGAQVRERQPRQEVVLVLLEVETGPQVGDGVHQGVPHQLATPQLADDRVEAFR